MKGERSTRKVEPFAVYSNQGNFLMIAFCRLRKDYRSFRIDKIENLITQNETFEPHKMTIKKYFEDFVKDK